MATLYTRRGGDLYAQWTDSSRSPRRKRHALKTKDRALASRLLERAEAAYRLGTFDPWIDTLDVLDPERPAAPITVSEACDSFLADRADAYAPLTVTNYRSVLNRFTAHVGPSVPLARLTVARLASYALASGTARATQSKRIGVLSALYGWAENAGHVDANLARQVKRPKVRGLAHSVVRKAVSESELEAICDAVRDDHERRMTAEYHRERCPRLWMAAAFRFAFYTGLRASEISRLTWSAVDLDAGTVAITEQKSGGADVLPLSPPALAVLRELAEDSADGYVFRSPWQRKPTRNHRAFGVNLNREFTAYRDSAGIDRPVTFHGLRHGFASHLAAKGKSAWLIQKACRHASVNVSQVYVSLHSDTLRSEGADVFGCPRTRPRLRRPGPRRLKI